MAEKDSSIITREILNTIRTIQENKTLPVRKKMLNEDGSDKELKAIVWLGAGLGTIIGCVNLFM